MSTATRANFFLIHRETGQRYPVKSYVTIGRLSGDIVFPRDPKLSAQHCRLLPTKRGVGVTDLESANGTFIDGTRLKPGRVFLFKAKSELSVGDQVFSLQSVNVAVPVRKKKGKRRKHSSTIFSTLLMLCLAVLGASLFYLQWRRSDTDTTLQVAQRDLNEVFDNFQYLRDSIDHQTAPPKDTARRLQIQVLNRLTFMATRWAAFQPQDDRQRRLLGLQQRFASALNAETQAEISYLNSGESKYLDDADQANDLIEQVSAEFRRQYEAHLINVASYPEPIQSPYQMVTREMRQALRDYQKLGNSVQDKEVPEKEVGNLLRKDLIPKLTAVAARLSAVKASGDKEAKRLALEKTLVAAFLSQVKAMSIYYDTKDAKYAKELEHWGDQIEKINGELKKLMDTARKPAGN
jgi:hypothetical protein